MKTPSSKIFFSRNIFLDRETLARRRETLCEPRSAPFFVAVQFAGVVKQLAGVVKQFAGVAVQRISVVVRRFVQSYGLSRAIAALRGRLYTHKCVTLNTVKQLLTCL